jgi:hypothetical protein
MTRFVIRTGSTMGTDLVQQPLGFLCFPVDLVSDADL